MKKHLLYTAFTLLLFGSCFTERGIAVDYVEKFSKAKYEATERIYVVVPKNVIRTNRSLNDIEDFHQMTPDKQDALIKARTKFVDKVEDSILLSQFKQHLLYNLSRIGIPIIEVSHTEQLPNAVENQIFILDIPQLEIEEYVEDKSVEYVTGGGTKYETAIPQNKISINVWYLFDKQSDEGTTPVYYYNWVFTDQVESRLVRDTDGNLKLHTKVNELNMNDVYYASHLAGKLSATYFLEKIINNYVESQKGKANYYYFYSPERNTITNNEVPYYYEISTFRKLSQE